MSSLTLGLDLGSNSIGWALIDEESSQLLAAGVRVFPEGVDRDKQGGEVSKNENRRIARGMRRQIARRARRKRMLRKCLVDSGLLPASALLPVDHPDRKSWESIQFHIEHPYALRSRALTEKLEPYEFGRILLHLCQRRGFLSNKKKDKAAKKETSDLLKEISELAAQMGDMSLGQYLAKIKADDPHARLRGRHTHRQMYQDEFERIWSAQQQYYPDLLTDDLKQMIHRIIFFQRKMYWPASVIGKCELEPRLPRCPRADRRAQRFRLLQEVNNLRLLDGSTGVERKLTEEEREKLLAYLSASKERTFDQIRRHLFEQHDNIRFNLERADRDKLKGLPTDAALSHKTLFGKSWHDLAEERKNRIVTAMINDEEEILKTLAIESGLDAERTEKLLDTDLEPSYSSYSLHAIKRLLPHLEKGLPLASRDGTPCALSEAGYLLPWQQVVNQQEYLPEPPLLTNPLVRQALFEVRKVVNAILREYVYRPGHKLAHVHIEMAREICGTAQQRERLSKEMRERERIRENAAEEIRKCGEHVTRDKIDRYLLWKEQNEVCIYSGRPISLVQLFGGEIDVDHILPYPRSLDNSLMNRVICFRNENAEKSDRTPWEWLAESDPTKYQQILQRADRLPYYPKAKRFRQKTVELDDFFARQFVDTAYITTQVHQYVRCLGADVLCPKGQHTAELRWQWGIDTVLRDDGLHLKNRDDHRHHAVDAIVIALTNRSRLQQLAGIRRRGGSERTGEVLPEPWPRFRNDVEDAVVAINVSHRARRKVSGSLHAETLYGGTNDDNVVVRRKPLSQINKVKQLQKVRDRTIREILIRHVSQSGIGVDSDQNIPANVWKTIPTMPSGVKIRNVRMLEQGEQFMKIRHNTYVEPGSNHHVEICIVLDNNGNPLLESDGRPKQVGFLVTMFEAAKRLINAQSVVQRKHGVNYQFVMSLTINEMFLLDMGNGQRILHRVQKMSPGSIILRPHTYAGKVSDTDKPPLIQRKTPNTLRGNKVTVDPLGRIRWAND